MDELLPTTPLWNSPSETPILSDDDVHVWRASLDPPASVVERLERTLATDERERAGRFRFSRHRSHFIAARGMLRAILGLYLEAEPAALYFQYGPRGKPGLAGDGDDGTLRFNLSHSGELALYAVARGRELGIDVEQIRSDRSDESIARRFFSPSEVEALLALPEGERRDAFFRCWTRKEAYIKARGDGLSLALDQFDVSLAPGEPATLLRTRQDAADAARWSLRDLPAGPGYAAALAVEGKSWRLRCWQWDPAAPP